jgi:hypothetical protein
VDSRTDVLLFKEICSVEGELEWNFDQGGDRGSVSVVLDY